MKIKRFHFFELADQTWCPKVIRDAETSLLEFFVRVTDYFTPIVPLLTQAMARTESRQIIDLCSGSGGPWLHLQSKFSSTVTRIILTDKYPNLAYMKSMSQLTQGRISGDPRSIDVMAIPRDLQGFRTMFTSFHHFRQNDGQAILADAVNKKAGIGIFEFTHRSLPALFAMCFTPLAVLLSIPFLKPRRFSPFFLSYILPFIPCCMTFDGFVSCLRTYSTEELRQMVTTIPSDNYTWQIGQIRKGLSPFPITYLVGYPEEKGQ